MINTLSEIETARTETTSTLETKETASRPKVIHVITKLELGGAQKVTLMTLERLSQARYDLELISGPEGLLCERAAGIPGLRCTWLPDLVREVRPIQDLRTLLRLWSLFRSRKPDIVHTHSSKAGILGRWSAWLAGVPIIFHTSHGFAFNEYQGKLTHAFYVWLERLTRRITTRSIVVSKANARRAEKLGILKPGQWVLCRDSIRVDEFLKTGPRRQQLRAWNIPADRSIVGMVACLKPQKSPVDFVNVAHEVLKSRRDVHFVLAGDGELREQVEARVLELGIQDRFTLLGWQTDMPEVYRNLDVFVLTSLWEGQPCVYSEAMASSLPIVATDVDGAREAIAKGQNGFLHDHHDVAAISRSILKLLGDASLRESMGAAGRTRVREFDIERSVSALESAYRQCLEDPKFRRAHPHV